VREGVESNKYTLIWIANNAQIADIIRTKILGRSLFDSIKELEFVKGPE
jgi:hypothetical protein